MASYFPMVKNSAQRIVFPIKDADGDPVTGAASDTPDSEYSLDGGSFSDIADEIHEIATASGVYYLDLTSDESNGDVVCIQVKTATAGTKTAVMVYYTSTQSLNTVDTVVDGIQTDLSNVTDGLGALKDLIDAIQTDLGDFSGRTNDQSLLDVLGVPDVAGKDLHTLLVTDRLDHGTYGLSALETLVDQLEGYCDILDDATNGLAAIKAQLALVKIKTDILPTVFQRSGTRYQAR